MDEWHYQRGETTFGPISGEILHALIQRGRLQDDTRVRRSDVAAWSTVTQVLADLPPIPEAPPPSPEYFTNTQPFDASQPGASVVYAPPQAALAALPQTGLPAALWFGMILCVVSLLFEIICWISMVLIDLSHLVDTAQWPQWFQTLALTLTDFLGVKVAIISTAVGRLAIALWQGCALASLKHLYGDMVRRSRASGLWWFVPIADLFLPLLCLRHMRHLSRKRRDFPNLHAPFGPLLITLEALILIRFPIKVFEGVSLHTHAETGYVPAMQLVLGFVIIALATTLLIIVISNFLQQKRLYAHWSDDAYWQNPDRC